MKLLSFVSEPWVTCVSSPCDNGGTCIDVNVDTFICMCRDGFFGTVCSESKKQILLISSMSFCELFEVKNVTVGKVLFIFK